MHPETAMAVEPQVADVCACLCYAVVKAGKLDEVPKLGML